MHNAHMQRAPSLMTMDSIPISNARIAERSGKFNSMEEAMSLSRKEKEALHQAIMRLARIIDELDNTSVDPRVLDMLEICGSLLEQQIEMDIVFEQCNTHSNREEVVLFENNETPDSNVVHINFNNNEEEDKDIPSAKELEDWFNI